MTNQSILSKVKALFEKTTENGCSQAEAQAAMKMANKLLLKYNLDIADVDDLDKEESPITQDTDLRYGMVKEEGKWERLLLNTIAKFNMCEIIEIRGTRARGGSFALIGEKHNIAIVKYTFDVARTLFRQLSKKSYNRLRAQTIQKHNQLYTELELQKQKILPYRTVYIRSYLKGAVQGLHQKLHEQQAESIKDNNKYGVMIQDNAVRIKDFIQQTFEVTERKTTSKVDPTAYKNGKKDGYETSISQGVGTTATDKKQLA